MSGRLQAKFTSAFSRDLKKKVIKRQCDLAELESVVDLVLDNTQESIEILKRRHRMHRITRRAVSSVSDNPKRIKVPAIKTSYTMLSDQAIEHS